MMYKHIAKDGSIVEMSTQAKNAIDHTIEANNRIKKNIKINRKEQIGECVDKALCEKKGYGIPLGRIPRKK